MVGFVYHPGRNSYKIIPWNNCFCNHLCIYYKNNYTRTFFVMLLPLVVPVCKRTCEESCFVKRLFCYVTKLVVPKLVFVFFCHNFGRDGYNYPQSGKTYILNSRRLKSVSVSVSLERINSKQIQKRKCKFGAAN